MILYINPVIFYLFLLLIQINRCTSVFFYFGSFICNPLHAARWAMAAAPSCSSPRPQLNYPPVYPFPTPGPACAVIVGVSPRSHSPHICQTKKRKQKTPTNQNRLFNPARPPAGTGPELHLASIPLLHRRGPPKSFPARSPGHLLSLRALRSLIALLLSCQPRSVGSARLCPPMWCGWCVVRLIVADQSVVSALPAAVPLDRGAPP